MCKIKFCLLCGEIGKWNDLFCSECDEKFEEKMTDEEYKEYCNKNKLNINK